MKSIRQLIYENAPHMDQCPLWLQEATPETAFKAVVEHYLDIYWDYLFKELGSAEGYLKQLQKQIEQYTEQIRRLQELDDAGMVKNLSQDVKDNKEILKKIIKERSEYFDYLRRLLKDVKEDVTPGLMGEICALLKETVPQYLMNANEARKRFKTQFKAMVNPTTLPGPVLQERLGAKRDLLAKSLGDLEADAENTTTKIAVLNKNLSEITNLRKNTLKKATKST